MLGFVLAPYFCKLVRFFPPVVTGTVITLIGVSLLPVAFNWSQGGNATADDYGSMTNIAMAAVTLVIVLALRKLLRGFLQQIAILLGLVIGTLIAIPPASPTSAPSRTPTWSASRRRSTSAPRSSRSPPSSRCAS